MLISVAFESMSLNCLARSSIESSNSLIVMSFTAARAISEGVATEPELLIKFPSSLPIAERTISSNCSGVVIFSFWATFWPSTFATSAIETLDTFDVAGSASFLQPVNATESAKTVTKNKLNFFIDYLLLKKSIYKRPGYGGGYTFFYDFVLRGFHLYLLKLTRL